MDPLIDHFYFNISKDGKQLYTNHGCIYLSSFLQHDNGIYQSFQFKIHENEVLKQSINTYKVTDLISLPFTKIIHPSEVKFKLLEHYFSALYVAYLIQAFNNSIEKPLLLENIIYCFEIETGYNGSFTNEGTVEGVKLYVHDKKAYIDKIAANSRYVYDWITFKIINKELILTYEHSKRLSL